MPPVKNVGEPCAGEPHARFEVAAGGNRNQSAVPHGTGRLPPTLQRHRRGARGIGKGYAVDRVWELLATALPAHLPSSRAARTRQDRDREIQTRFAELLERGECFERRVGDQVLLFDEPCCHGEPVAVTFAENDDAGRLTAAGEDCYGELEVGRSPRNPSTDRRRSRTRDRRIASTRPPRR